MSGYRWHRFGVARVPRATFDLDIPIEATRENVQHLLDALLVAGLATAERTTVDEVLDNEITIFRDRVRIDVQTFTPGIAFEPAWCNRVTTVSYTHLTLPTN